MKVTITLFGPSGAEPLWGGAEIWANTAFEKRTDRPMKKTKRLKVKNFRSIKLLYISLEIKSTFKNRRTDNWTRAGRGGRSKPFL